MTYVRILLEYKVLRISWHHQFYCRIDDETSLLIPEGSFRLKGYYERDKMENDTYIKIYRRVLEHPLLANDNNAYIVFTRLLLKVDRHTGSLITGRFKLAELTNLKPTTAWDVLKRLEEHKMLRQQSDNKKTRIDICNWAKWQAKPVSDPSSNRHQTVTKQEVRSKNKEYIVPNGTVELQKQVRLVYVHFLTTFEKNENTYKLTDKRKTKLRQRLKDAGESMVMAAITNTSQVPFYRGENDRGWKADLDFIIRSYEQVERLASEATSHQVITKEEIADYV